MSPNNRLNKCQLVEFINIPDSRGHLTVAEGDDHIPFEIKRVYYLHKVPAGSSRGGHAHRDLHQLLIPVSGSFDITLDDGTEQKSFHLDNPASGLYICPMVWREMERFSSNAVCLVLASEKYDEADYYRDKEQFIKDV